uniref:Uncharacterized protein n=1 Tax=Lactuca sativa TaxID=4236 RepID=A0A9R1VM13_LACSA|nr:hypothetical protein LSAT_V11C400206870 [Lactuca sativa]
MITLKLTSHDQQDNNYPLSSVWKMMLLKYLRNGIDNRRGAVASSNRALKQPTIRVVANIAEGVPESDNKELIIYARANNKVVIGPATVGGIQAGAFKIGDTAGTTDNIIQCILYRPGSVGFVSKSGCILLSVTMSNSDDTQTAINAQKLLDSLSSSDQNVIQIEKANYLTHFLHRSLSSEVKMSMVTTVAKMEFTDHSKPWSWIPCSQISCSKPLPSDASIECLRAPRMYGNNVNVSCKITKSASDATICCFLSTWRYLRTSCSSSFANNFDMYYLQLVRTCYNFYQSTSTKLAGENYFLHSGQLMFKSLFVIYTRWTTTNFLTWRICFLHDI